MTDIVWNDVDGNELHEGDLVEFIGSHTSGMRGVIDFSISPVPSPNYIPVRLEDVPSHLVNDYTNGEYYPNRVRLIPGGNTIQSIPRSQANQLLPIIRWARAQEAVKEIFFRVATRDDYALARDQTRANVRYADDTFYVRCTVLRGGGVEHMRHSILGIDSVIADWTHKVDD